MSQAPQSNVTPPASPTTDRPMNGGAAAGDPLARLHKMSTTAGVTNLDYVAVNQTAIAAVLLGLLSALSFFGYLLLVIPIVGAIFAMIALRQIGDSNGTQTGRGLALLGLLLCVVLGGAAIAREAVAVARVRGDESRIAATISQLGERVKEQKFQEAYELFDPDFRKRVSLDAFQKLWRDVQSGTLGSIDVMEWNKVTPSFESAEGRKVAGTKVRAKFTKGFDDRFDVVLRETDGRWLIVRLPQFFPENSPQQPGGGRPPQQQQQKDVFDF
jgi:hypothetical protein